MGVIYIISGPSGVGKGTLVKLLIQEDENLALSISCTTRAPRTGEVDGKDYFFITPEQFQKKKEEDGFLEYDEHFGSCYGTPKSFVFEKLKEKSVVLEIDVEGALLVQNKLRAMDNAPKVVSVMVTPPSLEELKRRLMGRKTETEEQILRRLERVKYELTKQNEYDFVVVNDQLNEAKAQIQDIITKTRKGDKKYD